MQPVQINWPVSSTGSIAANQTLGAAGSMLLNGALSRTVTNNTPVGVAQMPGSFERKVTLTSTGNISGVNFTIVGLDYQRNAVTEVLVGPNNSTVTSVNNYYIVSSITTNGAVATNTSAGTGSTGVTAWILGNNKPSPVSIGLYISITANTLNVTVEGTPDNPFITASPALFPHSILTAITSSDSSEWPYGVNYVRFKVNSSDATGTGTFSTIQAGY